MKRFLCLTIFLSFFIFHQTRSAVLLEQKWMERQLAQQKKTLKKSPTQNSKNIPKKRQILKRKATLQPKKMFQKLKKPSEQKAKTNIKPIIKKKVVRKATNVTKQPINKIQPKTQVKKVQKKLKSDLKDNKKTLTVKKSADGSDESRKLAKSSSEKIPKVDDLNNKKESKEFLSKEFVDKFAPQYPPQERRLQDKSSSNNADLKKTDFKIDPTSLEKLQKYSMTSVMTLVALKLTEEPFTQKNDKGKGNPSRKLGALGKFINGQNLREVYSKEKVDMKKYLKENHIKLKRNMKVNEIESIVKRYLQEKFKIPAKSFNQAKPMITSLYQIALKQSKKML